MVLFFVISQLFDAVDYSNYVFFLGGGFLKLYFTPSWGYALTINLF